MVMRRHSTQSFKKIPASTSQPSYPGKLPERHSYTTHHTKVDAKIRHLFRGIEDSLDRQLLMEMAISVYRLGEDSASTGDLKILNAVLKELRYAFKVFRPYRHIRKVAMFGSARLEAGHPAYLEAKRFGHLISEAHWMVITGAASGIMRAGHEGAGSTLSFGLNIRLPFEQQANTVIAEDTKLINCKYFFTRKLLFIKESHATVLFPGGFGTLDEGFESMTLVQTGKSDPRPIVFVELSKEPFWKPMLRFIDEQLVRQGMISRDEHSIFQVARSAQEAASMIQQFYAVYHSMRYVGRELVIRLQKKLPETLLSRLSRDFRDLLVRGDVRQDVPLHEEADEPELGHLPRLILSFDRKSYGRLIQLIHRINRLAG